MQLREFVLQTGQVIHEAVERGCMLDTSDIYGPFTNEELIGKNWRGQCSSSNMLEDIFTSTLVETHFSQEEQ